MHKQTADHSPGADPVSPPPALPEAARRVQPFGTLLLLDATTLRVRRCSADAPALLGTSAEVLLGDSVCKYLTAAAGKELTLFQHGVVPRRETTFTLPALRRRKLPVLMRRSAGVLLVELLHGPGKLAPRAPQSSGEQVARRIGDCHLCLAQTTSVPQLNQQLAALALAHLGYAHVAVLRLEPTHELTLQARADALNEAAAPLDGLRQLHAGLLPIDLLSADDDGYAVIGDSEAENIELLSADPAEAALPVPPSCLLRAPAEAGLGPLRRLGGRSLLAVRLRRRIAPTGSTEPAWGVLLCWAPGPQVPDGVARALAQTLAQLHAQQLSVLSEQQDTRLTELRVRGAIEASGEPICILDLQGNPVLVNAAMAKLTGRPSAALRNRYQLEMLLDGPSLPEQLAATFAAGARFWQGETTFIRPDGEAVQLELRVDLITQDDGTPVGYVTVCRDLRSRRQAEERLRLLDSAFMNSRLALLIGRFPGRGSPRGLLVNPAFTELTHVSGERALADPLACVLGKEPDLNAVHEIAASLEDRESRRIEYLFRREGGDPFWAELRMIPSISATGTDLIMTLSDISAQQQAQAEKREMERRLQESQNLDSLGVLAAGIAHDFNNLLTGILGNASLLRAEVRRGRMTDSYLAQIEDTALRAAELCRQMLAYAGKGQFERRELVINEVVEETLSLLGPGPLNRHSVQLKLTGNLPMVLGDGAQLRQVLSNLLRNAAESLRPRPGAASASGRSPSRQGRESPSEPRGEKAGSRRTITVVTSLQTLDGDAIRGSYGDSAAPPGAYVAFEVQDTGSGIAPEVQKRMFEPFFSTRPDGRGLGLSTVLGIVRRHGGVLRVRTELDRGSSFTVLLPAVDPARLRQ